jgi:hypothetical protein
LTPPVCQPAPAQPAGRGFLASGPEGEIVETGPLRLLNVADYSVTPALVPATPIGGAEAFNLDIPHTPPCSETVAASCASWIRALRG